LNLEVILPNGNRSRELIRIRIEGIPLGFGLLSDEHGKRNAALRGSTRLDHRIGDCRALGEGRGSETLGDGGGQKTVVLLRFIGESEEGEEKERAKDDRPSIELKQNVRIPVKQHHRDLDDTGIVEVGISPGDPRKNLGTGGVRDHQHKGNWDGHGDVDGGQNDETPVAVVSQHATGGGEISELFSPVHKGTDSEKPIGGRDKADN